MENLRTFVQNKIEKNQLNLDIDETISIIESYRKVYEDSTDEKRFYHYIMNQVGMILNKYAETDLERKEIELIGWLRVRGSSRTNVVYYEYETDDEFYQWLQYRLKFYDRIKKHDEVRLINYLELSTMNFIQDISTNCSYFLTKETAIDEKITNFSGHRIEKNGYGTDQDNLSFIKYMSTKFNDGFNFKPVI